MYCAVRYLALFICYSFRITTHILGWSDSFLSVFCCVVEIILTYVRNLCTVFVNSLSDIVFGFVVLFRIRTDVLVWSDRYTDR